MQNFLVNQWLESIKTSIASIKAVTETGEHIMDNLSLKMWDVRDYTAITKSLMEMADELRKLNEHVMNASIKRQLGTMDLESSAEMIREFDDIRANAVTRLINNQMDILSLTMDVGADYLEKFRQASTLTDLTTVQMHFFSDLQARMKENIIDSLSIMDGISTAMREWTEKAIDNIAGDDS